MSSLEKLKQEGQLVEFDFNAPKLFIVKGDKTTLATTVAKENIVAGAVRIGLTGLINAAFPQGMTRADSKIWAAWQEVLEDDSPTVVDVTRGQVEWLKKYISDATMKIPVGLAQWREAITDYLEELLKKE